MAIKSLFKNSLLGVVFMVFLAFITGVPVFQELIWAILVKCQPVKVQKNSLIMPKNQLILVEYWLPYQSKFFQDFNYGSWPDILEKNLKNLHKIQIISKSHQLSLKTLIKWSMEPSYSLIKVGNWLFDIALSREENCRQIMVRLQCHVRLISGKKVLCCSSKRVFCSF